LLVNRLRDLGGQDSFINSYRYQSWSRTMRRSVSSPSLLVAGSGLGTYGGYVSLQLGYSEIITENQYLKILGEEGLVGLSLFLLVIGCTLLRHGPKIDRLESIFPGTAVCLVIPLLYLFVGNMLDGMTVAMWFWTIVGLRLSGLCVRQPQASGAFLPVHRRGIADRKSGAPGNVRPAAGSL
jgi:hypothetical protein